LHLLHHQHPSWSHNQLAQALSRSRSWVKKWLKRFREAAEENRPPYLWNQPKPRPKVVVHKAALNPLLVSRILAIRDQPPENLKRIPGPRTIAYYLKRDPLLKQAGLTPPGSTSLIWKILDLNKRIARPKARRPHPPLARPAPMSSWQWDFKDNLLVSIEPDGKKAHLVETLDVMDEGTDFLIAAEPRADYNAETALETTIAILKRFGVPQQVTFDRDPRWVGSHTGRDYPSAFVKFWHCLGVRVNLCPPHRPDLNCYVERYHRSYGQECLAVLRPQSLGEVKEVTAQYREHYNWERPNQSEICKDQPPRVAFGELPGLPALPMTVDPDRWLEVCQAQHYVRKVDWRGCIRVDKHHYYLNKQLAGKHVQVELDGKNRQLVVRQEQQELKRLKIKGLYGGELPFEKYAELIVREARSERRLAQMRARAKQVGASL
jgi:hypothetical protein